MAETRGDQVAFGWAGESGSPPQVEASAEAVAKAPGAAAEGRPARSKAQVARKPVKPRGEAAGTPALPPDDELWDVQAAARYLKRSVSWVYHRAEDGSLPVKRLAGWGLRFIPGDLRAWVETGGVAPVRRRE